MAISYIERLTIRTWLWSVLPSWVRGYRGTTRYGHRCYVFESHALSIIVARWVGQLLGWTVEPLSFRLMDVHDEEGLLIRLRIAYRDLAEVQSEIVRAPAFQRSGTMPLGGANADVYLAKASIATDMGQRSTLLRALLLIHISTWHMRQTGQSGTVTPRLFLERRPWFAAIRSHAQRAGIALVPVTRTMTLRYRMRRAIPPQWLEALRLLRDRAHGWRLRLLSAGSQPWSGSIAAPTGASSPRLAVECYGQFNTRHPECYSDLFFWQQSSLPARDIVVLFGVPRDPLNAQKLRELREHGMQAVVMHPRATTIAHVPLHVPHLRRQISAVRPTAAGGSSEGLEGAWLDEQARAYAGLRQRWVDLCDTHQIKVYVSWYKYDATHCAISDALHHVGGVSAIYQRAHEDLPSAETTIGADVLFGFSHAGAEVERQSHSRIAYRVTTGYLGDHRFALLKEQAKGVRAELQRHGAQRVLAFCDENSHDDERWSLGHHLTRRNYACVLERLLQTPWLGLIIKPKAPATLRRRLGPVSDLLAQAEATGRCFVYQAGMLQSAHPPAAAALAADVLVHGHLCAATAGMEAALVGVPSLLMDGEGWSVSPLYRLGVGQVVFTDWDHLWRTCQEHWNRRGGVPGFGDWSPILPDLDPFRDGRAAERMGAYLQWLLEGFRHGLSRETVLADAAERYQARWGREMVQHINVGRPGPVATSMDAPFLQTASAGIHGA